MLLGLNGRIYAQVERELDTFGFKIDVRWRTTDVMSQNLGTIFHCFGTKKLEQRFSGPSSTTESTHNLNQDAFIITSCPRFDVFDLYTAPSYSKCICESPSTSRPLQPLGNTDPLQPVMSSSVSLSFAHPHHDAPSSPFPPV